MVLVCFAVRSNAERGESGVTSCGMKGKQIGRLLTRCEEPTTERIFRDSFCGLDIRRNEGHGNAIPLRAGRMFWPTSQSPAKTKAPAQLTGRIGLHINSVFGL